MTSHLQLRLDFFKKSIWINEIGGTISDISLKTVLSPPLPPILELTGMKK